ncbi:hypothetical protein L1049_027226 [Liquidambar formosana]|uniref:Uncharacterized protein n=1 Tax=Liquidambar formosana TaxID=63359 RepID=A0AAP0N4N9_LIQFO
MVGFVPRMHFLNEVAIIPVLLGMLHINFDYFLTYMDKSYKVSKMLCSSGRCCASLVYTMNLNNIEIHRDEKSNANRLTYFGIQSSDNSTLMSRCLLSISGVKDAPSKRLATGASFTPEIEAKLQGNRSREYVSSWAPIFHPIPDSSTWPILEGPTLIADERLRRGKGRPKSTRLHNEMDIREGRAT